MEEVEEVTVWCLPLRLFHWALALGGLAAFISGEVHAAELHAWIGYVLVGLLCVRLYMGFRGNEHARFQSFLFPPGETLAYARSMLRGRPRHYLGHNPAGALMVFALLGLLAMLFATGLLTLGAIDFDGPLVFIANRVSDETGYAMHHLHGLLAHAALAAVGLHLAGVIVGSIQHRENLVRAMITGKKHAPSVPTKS